jgi:hypothetical protein
MTMVALTRIRKQISFGYRRAKEQTNSTSAKCVVETRRG